MLNGLCSVSSPPCGAASGNWFEVGPTARANESTCWDRRSEIMVEQFELSKTLKAVQHGESRLAFTLVELTATLLVLSLLTLLGLPTLVRANQRTKEASCRSNLRQVGFALQSYTDLNNGLLPGPVSGLAAASYDQHSTNELVWYLAERLGCPAPAWPAFVAPQFLCPGQRQERSMRDELSARDYALNDGRGASITPFGKVGSGGVGPVKLESLGAATRLEDCPAISDADKANVNPTLPGWGTLPCRPVHGNGRNVLFFDGHVATKR